MIPGTFSYYHHEGIAQSSKLLGRPKQKRACIVFTSVSNNPNLKHVSTIRNCNLASESGALLSSAEMALWPKISGVQKSQCFIACERSWTKAEMSCANKQRLSTAVCSKSTSSHRSSSVELTTCVVFLGLYPSLYTNMPTQWPPHAYAEWGQCLCRGFLTWGTNRAL